jgi:hypothetical protein
MSSVPWFEDLKDATKWSGLWRGWIRCGCGGLRRGSELCAACERELPEPEYFEYRDADGNVHRVPPANMGAEGRYQDYLLLDMLANEWLRPLGPHESFENVPPSVRPAAKAVVVLLFWTYFETKIERLLRDPSRNIVPDSVLDYVLRRDTTIASRLSSTYKALYATTYWEDLRQLGYSQIEQLLKELHEARNKFVHGHPEAITKELVERLVASLKDEHESWIAVFNARVKAASAQQT